MVYDGGALGVGGRGFRGTRSLLVALFSCRQHHSPLWQGGELQLAESEKRHHKRQLLVESRDKCGSGRKVGATKDDSLSIGDGKRAWGGGVEVRARRNS